MGVIVLGSVIWNYVLNIAQQKTTLSIILSVIGAILVSTSLWTSIVIKGPQWEVNLLREQSVKQFENYLKVVEDYKELLPPEKAAIVSPKANKLRSSLKELKEAQDDQERLKIQKEVFKRATDTASGIAAVRG
jgi:hypothetical protein